MMISHAVQQSLNESDAASSTSPYPSAEQRDDDEKEATATSDDGDATNHDESTDPVGIECVQWLVSNLSLPRLSLAKHACASHEFVAFLLRRGRCALPVHTSHHESLTMHDAGVHGDAIGCTSGPQCVGLHGARR